MLRPGTERRGQFSLPEAHGVREFVSHCRGIRELTSPQVLPSRLQTPESQGVSTTEACQGHRAAAVRGSAPNFKLGWRRGTPGEVFLTPTISALIPAGCPTVQIHSNTICLETVSDRTGYGLPPTSLPPTLEAMESLGYYHHLLELHYFARATQDSRETVRLLDCWFFRKKYHLGTPEAGEGRGQALGRAQNLHALPL